MTRILGVASVVGFGKGSLRITLITEAAKMLRVKAGDKVAFLDEDGRLVIAKA